VADLSSLGYKSLSEMTKEEGIELIRQIRMSRRIPVKKPKKTTTTTTRRKKATPKVTTNQAAELLKLLTGGTA
jgi:topoisomerase IA-like protein